MRLIKKIADCINAILAAAVVSVTLLSGVAASKVNVSAEEITDKSSYYLEDYDTMNKNGVEYVIDNNDLIAFKEYFGYLDDASIHMNIFYEDSTLYVDTDKSVYSFDNIIDGMAEAYKLSRDESGKLIFTKETWIWLGKEDGRAGYGIAGINQKNFLWNQREGKFCKMTFSELYNSKSSDGSFQTEVYEAVSDVIIGGAHASGGKTAMHDIDFVKITFNYKKTDGTESNVSSFVMPDYMIDKTVLDLTKATDEKTDDAADKDDTYIFDAADKDTQIVEDEIFTNILKENESKDVVIKSNNNVTFTFAKGTMQKIGGKNEYDFSTTINSAYAEAMPSYVTKDNFISQINFNYSGELPAIASIRIPVGTQYAGKTLYYSYMNNDNTFADTQTVVVDEEGYITVKQDHCSSYVVTNKAPEYVSAGSKDTEQDTQITESNTESTSTDISAPTDENVDTPQTSDNNNVYIYVACIILALTGVIKYGKMKKAY